MFNHTMILLLCYYERGRDTRNRREEEQILPGDKFPSCGLTAGRTAPREEA